MIRCVVCEQDFEPHLHPGALFFTAPQRKPGTSLWDTTVRKFHLCASCGDDVERNILTRLPVPPKPTTPYSEAELSLLSVWLKIYEGRPFFTWLLTVRRLLSTIRALKAGPS